MKMSILNTWVARSFVLLLSFQLLACGGGNHDAEIQTRITAATQATPELEGVTALVSEGVVTLIGQTRSESDREKAENSIKKIDDVKDVINNIIVNDNVVVASDNELRDQSREVLKNYKHVRADVNEGIITLRGNVDKDDLQQMMMDLNALRPRRLNNQLVVE